MPRFHDLTGKRFGRLIVKKFSHISHHRTAYWFCLCDCGNTIKAVAGHLKNGHIKSCKCLNREIARKTMTKHGMYKTPEYRAWIGMRMRCKNSKWKGFKYYGGRGIKVCKRWESFENFFSDIGIKPFIKASLDRMNNNGNYSPDNCKWSNRITQNNNNRHNHKITIGNITKNLIQWLKHFGITPTTYHARIRLGWNILDALQKPVRKHKLSYPSA